MPTKVEKKAPDAAEEEVKCSIMLSLEDWRRVQQEKGDTRKSLRRIMTEALHDYFEKSDLANQQAKPSRAAIRR